MELKRKGRGEEILGELGAWESEFSSKMAAAPEVLTSLPDSPPDCEDIGVWLEAR